MTTVHLAQPPPSGSSTSTAKLSSLLQTCLDHLESSSKDDDIEFSSVYFSTMAALQDHAMQQFKLLQAEVATLQAKRQEYLHIIHDVEQQQQQQQNQRQKMQQQRPKQEQCNAETRPPFDNKEKLTSVPGKIDTPNAAPNIATKEHSSHAQPSLSATNNPPPDSHLTPLELQKKALMEKRRQEVLEQRKKAAEEQKRIKEEERRKFLEYEQRKQDLKLQAAKEAALQREKALQEEMLRKAAAEEAAAAFPPPRTKPQCSPLSSAPTASPESLRSTHVGLEPNSPSIPIQEPRPHPSPAGLNMPNLPKGTQPTTTTKNVNPSPFPADGPPSGAPPDEPSMPSHIPTGSDAKYRNMMAQSPPPPESATPTETPQHVITTLKHNILLQWALLPPTYQVLKPIPQLLCQIHCVYPPALGLPPHSYFQGWTPIVWTELATNSAWDPAKLKKAVRKVRFFLHPDKLPRDFNDAQQFLCKLLWDVVNDAYEDYQAQLLQSPGQAQ